MKDPEDWDRHRIALAVLESGGVGAAARALGVSAAKVSRHLAAYEVQVGGALVERRPTGTVVTLLGTGLLEPLREAHRAVAAVRHAAAGFADAPRGTVRLATMPMLASDVLVPFLPTLRAAYPEIDLELLLHHETVNLARGDADLAIRTARPRQGSLQMKRIGRARLGAFAAGCLLDRRPSPLPWIDWPAHVEVMERRWLDAVAPQRHVVLRVDDPHTQVRACLAGVGALTMTDVAAGLHPTLRPVEGLPPGPEVALYLTMPRSLRQIPRMNAVWTWVSDLFARGPDALGRVGAR